MQQTHTRGPRELPGAIRARSLDELDEYRDEHLPPHSHVHQLRADIILKAIKGEGFRIVFTTRNPIGDVRKLMRRERR